MSADVGATDDTTVTVFFDSDHEMTALKDKSLSDDQNSAHCSTVTNDLEGRRFQSFESGLEPFVKEIGKRQGFVNGRDAHKMNPERAIMVVGHDDVVQRGFCTADLEDQP